MFIVDTNSFRVLGSYYPDVFPTFWEQLDTAVADGQIGSVREVKKELELQDASEHLGIWVAANPLVFPTPTEGEMQMVAEIFRVTHFQQLIGEKQRLRGQPVADPFIVARLTRSVGAWLRKNLSDPTRPKSLMCVSISALNAPT